MEASVSLRRRVRAAAGELEVESVLAGILDVDAPESNLAACREVVATGLLTYTTAGALERAQALGLGRRQAVRLVLCARLVEHDDRGSWAMPAPITTPSEVLGHVVDIRCGLREQVVALYLDSRSRPIHRELLGIGGLRASVIAPRDVLAPALGRPVAALILVHNHPSGDTHPSADDLHVTRQLAAACEVFGITLLDHLVVSRTGYTSIKELGGL